MASALALAVYALLLVPGVVAVWRRPRLALYAFAIGLAVHNAVMDALYAAGVGGAALTAIQAWKELLLGTALASVGLAAVRARRLPFRPVLPDWLALAFAALVVLYALIPQSALGGLADHKAIAYALRHDLVPVAVYLLFRALPLGRDDLRRLGWTLLGTAALVAAIGIVDVYAVPIGWWRGNGTVEYFRDRLGFTYHGTGDLPENFVYNTGSEVHFLRRLVSTFLSPLAAGYLFVVALLLAPRRRLALALGSVVFAGLLFTFSRSSLLALAAGIVVLALVRRSPRPLALAVLVVAVSVGWAHLFPHVGPTGRWTAQDLVLQRQIAAKKGPTGGATSLGESSISSHLTNLREGVRAVLDHPQGYGLGNAGEVASRAGTHLYAGESNYTELGVETGLLGALLWIAWGLAVLVGLVRSRAAGAAAAFAAVLVLAVQTDVLGDPWIAYCVWALAGGLLVPTMERSWRSIPESTLATST